MLNKYVINDFSFGIKATGPIEDDTAINLEECITPYSNTALNRHPVRTISSQNNFSMKIGGTTFNVRTHFDSESSQSVLKQFKDLILSENLV